MILFKNKLYRSYIVNIIPIFLCLLILTLFCYFSYLANSDLSLGRFVLDMDERITFDGVKAILHPNGMIEFIKAIVFGDQRYGRSLWMSISLFSFFPERLCGEHCQIIASRMCQVFLIFSVWFIFAFGILSNWYMRLLLAILIMSMPYSDYYFVTPKPEPLQIFFIAFFCYFYFKAKLAFGWHWIFAGLAFGTKISTLPVLIVFGIFSFFASYKSGLNMDAKRSIMKSIFSFLIGLSIAVPILIIPSVLIIGSYFFCKKILIKFNMPLYVILSIRALLIIFTFFLSKKALKVWLASTFFNTKHGSDQSHINFWSWISFYFEKWLVLDSLLSAMLFISIFIYIYFLMVSSLRSTKKNDFSANYLTAFSIFLSGLILNLSIFFGVHRLWGFYLYPGSILIFTGLVILIDLVIKERSQKSLKIFSFFIYACTFLVSLYAWTPHIVKSLDKLASRTQSTEYKDQYASYLQILSFLEQSSEHKNKVLEVMFTPSLFLPESNQKYRINEFWGPYTQWDNSPDLIVFGKINTPRGKPTPIDSPEYEAYLAERRGYFKHVVDKPSYCIALPCYERLVKLSNGGEILSLVK